jgi:hypothetical protein
LTRPALLHDGVSFGVTADEAASLDIQLIARPRWLRAARSGDIVIARKKWPLAGGRRAVKIKVLPKLRRRFTHGRADLRLTVLATDAAGNRTRLTKPLTIR